MKHKTTTPDWALMIHQLLEGGLTTRKIGDAMSFVLTNRMVRHYQLGVQPLHFRGEALIALWCSTLKRERGDLPTMELSRGHRVDNRERTQALQAPVVNLPAWPPAPSVPNNRRGRRAIVAA